MALKAQLPFLAAKKKTLRAKKVRLENFFGIVALPSRALFKILMLLGKPASGTMLASDFPYWAMGEVGRQTSGKTCLGAKDSAWLMMDTGCQLVMAILTILIGLGMKLIMSLPVEILGGLSQE